jgi:hypothetical protein
VLEIGKIELENRWLSSAKVSAVWVHRTVSGGAPDSVRCARLAQENLLLSGKKSTVYGYNSPDCPVCTGLSGVHRTVR